jgi:hypothetical protein
MFVHRMKFLNLHFLLRKRWLISVRYSLTNGGSQMFKASFLRFSLPLILTLVLGVGVLALSPQSAHAATGWSYDNEYSPDVGCGGTALSRYPGENTNITVMWSSSCQTNWAKISVGQPLAEVALYRRISATPTQTTATVYPNGVGANPNNGIYIYHACVLGAPECDTVPWYVDQSYIPNPGYSWWTNMLYAPDPNYQVQACYRLQGSATEQCSFWH